MKITVGWWKEVVRLPERPDEVAAGLPDVRLRWIGEPKIIVRLSDTLSPCPSSYGIKGDADVSFLTWFRLRLRQVRERRLVERRRRRWARDEDGD